jgi:hypothetical protein
VTDLSEPEVEVEAPAPFVSRLLRGISRIFYGITAAAFLLLALALIGIAGLELYTSSREPLQLLGTLLESIGLVTVALAVFEVGRFLLEEELLRARELRTIADARLSLTKFMTITVIVLTIEGLVLLFKIRRESIADMIYPTGLLIVAVLALVGLGVFRKLTDAFATGAEHAAEKEISKRSTTAGSTKPTLSDS